MANLVRRDKINGAMQQELSLIIREVKDPRVSEAFVSITSVIVSPDLKNAKVHFSTLTGDKKEVKKGLVSAQGFLRKRVAEKLNLRETPQFNFSYDESISYGAHISKVLSTIKFSEDFGGEYDKTEKKERKADEVEKESIDVETETETETETEKDQSKQ